MSDGVEPRRDSNRKLMVKLLAFALGSFAFGFALVPFYDVLCDITGFGNQKALAEARVSVEQPDGVRLVRYAADGTRRGTLPDTATLLAGDEVVVGIECVKDGEALAGTVPATWSGMTDAISVVPALEPDRYRLVARQSGKATLVAQAGTLSAGFAVEVMP